MKTEDILNLDCNKEKNRDILSDYLWKIKPLEKYFAKNGYIKRCALGYKELLLLEEFLQQLCIRYDYRHQGFNSYIETTDSGSKSKFVFYSCSILNPARVWIGTVYGRTLWEIVVKTVIKIYADIKKEKEKC